MQRTKITVASVLGLVLLAGLAGTTGASPSKRTWTIGITSDRAGKSGDIYSMSVRGTNVRRLTSSPKADGFPVWSPDERKIIFYSQRSLKGDVWVMNPDGSAQRNLTRNAAHDSPGSWSPDGRRIAFDTDRDGNNELYVMNADGSGQRILTPSPSAQEWDPQWSPDGRTISFVSDRDGNAEIYAMNADGSDPRNLTHSPANDAGLGGVAGLLWSPDGRKIAFVSTRDTRAEDNPELYVMNADGSGVQRLTRTPGVESLLSWSPDGKRIAFQRSPSNPRWAFYVMNADGSGARKVNWSLPRKQG